MLRKQTYRPLVARSPVRVERYKGRHWAVYDRFGMVAVTVYRKGAEAMADRLTPTRVRAKRRRRPATA